MKLLFQEKNKVNSNLNYNLKIRLNRENLVFLANKINIIKDQYHN